MKIYKSYFNFAYSLFFFCFLLQSADHQQVFKSVQDDLCELKEKRNEALTALYLLSQKKNVQLSDLQNQTDGVGVSIKALDERLKRYKAGALQELAFLQEQSMMHREQLNNLICITDTLLDDQKKRDDRYGRKRFTHQ